MCTHANTHTHLCVHISLNKHTYTCTYAHAYTSTYTSSYICVYIFTYPHAYIGVLKWLLITITVFITDTFQVSAASSLSKSKPVVGKSGKKICDIITIYGC